MTLEEVKLMICNTLPVFSALFGLGLCRWNRSSSSINNQSCESKYSLSAEREKLLSQLLQRELMHLLHVQE